MPFTPKQHREYRIKLKKEGRCTCCHKPFDEENTNVVCAKCIESNNAKRKERRKDKTKCNDCLNRLDEFTLALGRTLCPYCNEKRRVNSRRWYHATKRNKTQLQ